ncbi:structural maintenance of chromosomes flexible hinge domain-containing protein 1 isoform X1 [Hippoglossus stenolepis]|uniref:structural maintenance of chromosomes flexible hinge domain-containing protein 1 isoform X1 n=1 Tax=Hippoglossus stenolepis TaxID=195615 RepID=UPI001FB002E3|nr:structural maintenance of chromosomes flexible hinge domain-containing protein 1 isoform X1 [Hippoglossus stenolepis]
MDSNMFLVTGPKRRIRVCDCRLQTSAGSSSQELETSGMNYHDFLRLLSKKFPIRSDEIFVVATTDRTALDSDKFEELQAGCTLYLLHKLDQDLPAAMEEQITFVPHYDTLIEGGLYEYYDSEGQTSLSYTLAELIDNSLWATSKNTEMKTIEIRMLFDESLGKAAIIALDNGCGMTSQKLKEWAVYRCSKFNRASEKYVRPDPAPRSLNSDISYFGVGGKQAIFYIGDSVRMITKPVGCPDVHELILSKEDFKRKEQNKEDIYKSVIKNRKPGDPSHVIKDDERFLHSLIAEEPGKESFTAVVITGIRPEHITFLKQHFKVLTRQLAHTYHYYIHGVNGNDPSSSFTNSDHSKIDIQVTLREKPLKLPHVVNLREIDDDMQTLYIKAAADTFEFKAATGVDTGRVEGIIRYHPFLYDKETYPEGPEVAEAPRDEEDEMKARGKRPIFECFWNGRLIPYTTVQEFDWCAWKGAKGAKVPEDCYGRFSGVLFTDDKFQVTTNKLTFMDLEQKVKGRETIFTRVVNGQEQRTHIQTQFTQWLKNCHENLDKQVKFLSFGKFVTRPDMTPKKMQHPWATFSAIEWDGKIYKTGQLVKSQKTQPIIHGTVVQFLLYGDHDRDVFATGGQVEVRLEPKSLYNKNKIIPIFRIDKNATDEGIKKNIENDLGRLPHELKVIWQEPNGWPQNGFCPAGTPLGPLSVEIMNKKGEVMSRMPATSQGTVIRLSVKLTVLKNGPEKAEEVLSLVALHSARWGFGFKKIERLNDPGSYTLSLNTLLHDTSATVFGGRDLPSSKISFTITAGTAEAFVLGEMSSTLHVGVPFDIPLQITDGYGNSTKPLPSLLPELECRGLEVSFAAVDCSGSKFIIKGVKARGKLLNNQPVKKYDLRVTLTGLKNPTQTIKISLLPGTPHTLHVKTDDNPIVVQNGTAARFNVEVHDEAGNITTHPRQIVHCQVPGLTPTTVDYSRTGAGQLVTKPINLKIVRGEPQKLRVQFEMPSRRNVESVVRELTVIPSTRVSQIMVCSQNDESLVLRSDEKIEWLAGGSLDNLFYKLHDEAGRVVPITTEIASMIKVNWTNQVDLKDLVLGKLPVAQVPTQVQEERFYQVSYQDQSVTVSFSIVPRPDEPAKLKTTLLNDTVKLGETLSGNINLELVDKYDNATRTLTATCVNDLNVKAEGLDKEAVTFKWRESSRSVDVTGICFHRGTPGIKNLLFTYQTYTTYQIVNVAAGDPAMLKLVGGPSQPLQVINDHSIPTPFLIQLVDEWGNVSTDKRVVVVMKSSPSELKVSSAVVSQPVDSEGKASFTVNSVSGQRGCYQLDFNGSLNNKLIPGPTVNLTVLPNPNKPVCLTVEYSTAARFPAGGTFPVFSVTVVSDEGSPMTTFNPAAVTMLLWEGEASNRRPPQTPTELKCSKPMENERKDCFHFRDKKIPETAGNHTVQFSLLIDQTNFLLSDQIPINVVANQPVKLAPESQPPAPVVSCCRDVKNRTLVQDMTLRIMDSYGNPAGKDLDGKLVVSITNCSGDGAKPTPLFDGRINRYEISLAEGQVHFTRLAIMENSPGEDGSEYTLRFQPDVPQVPTPLAPFELTFHFYDDAVNQQRVCDLLKKKESLSSAVSVLKQLFDGYSELLNLFTVQRETASIKVADQREVLKRQNVTVTESIPAIDRLLTEKTKEAYGIRTAAKRVCSIRDDFRGQQDVLGMVGHLAYVQDDAAARVISWQISGDMDCVVTGTTEAARRIYDDTRGRQQVMALDSVLVPQMNRPLPHIRNGRSLFEPRGNPVFARDLLIFPRDEENCAIVFANFLSDTILMDDLDSANDYRRALVQKKIRCPTILTRQGDRISARGKFGGTQNRCPPITSLKVFGAPLPQHFYTLQEQIDLLRQYRTAVEKKEKAEKDRDDHSNKMKSPVMIKKQQDKETKEKQLEEIERQLNSTTMGPQRRMKRGLEDAAGPLDSIAKRAK